MDADHQVVGVALSDESTANRIPDLFVDEIVLPVEGLESHAVGMGRHAVPYIHHHIASVIEIDAMRAVEHQLAACLAFHTDIAHVIGIDGFRYVAFQARHRGAIGTVPKTGQGEPYSTVRTRPTRFSMPSRSREAANLLAATIGPTVCDELGPTPMVNISRMLNMYIALSFPRLRRHAA